MRVVDFNCIKCGNPLQAPEKSERVLCAVCGTTNSPGGALAKLKGLIEKSTMSSTGSYGSHNFPERVEDQPVDDPFFGQTEGHTLPDEADKTPGKRNLGLTAILLLMPVIIMVSEQFGISSKIVLALVAVIFIVFIASKGKK